MRSILLATLLLSPLLTVPGASAGVLNVCLDEVNGGRECYYEDIHDGSDGGYGAMLCVYFRSGGYQEWSCRGAVIYPQSAEA